MDEYGPPLPPGFAIDDQDNEDNSLDLIKEPGDTKVIGPQIPDFLLKRKSEENSGNDIVKKHKPDSSIIGPQLPSLLQDDFESDDNDDDEVYGPMPPQADAAADDDVYKRSADIEKRAANMRNMLDNKNVPVPDVVEREEWMTVPDTSRKNQLGAISRCLAPEAKQKASKDKHSHRHKEKDRKTSEELKKYNKSKRAESLLEMHQKDKKKKDKEKKSKEKERKAFDREEMAVRHFTSKQVDSVIDKAKFLNSRFKAGNSQYL